MIAETEEELIERLREWKEGVESEGMRVGMNRARVVVGGERRMVWRRAAGWPCGVCGGVLVAIRCSVLDAGGGCMRGVVV